MPKTSLCPCDSKLNYTICCGRYHKGKITAPTAEALMRSRYSAYVMNNSQYVYRTWDKDTRPPLSVLREDSSQKFIRLEILNTKEGGIGSNDEDSGTVEFIASYVTDSDNKTHDHHENSYFVKRKKCWFYVNEFDKVDFEN